MRIWRTLARTIKWRHGAPQRCPDVSASQLPHPIVPVRLLHEAGSLGAPPHLHIFVTELSLPAFVYSGLGNPNLTAGLRHQHHHHAPPPHATSVLTLAPAIRSPTERNRWIPSLRRAVGLMRHTMRNASTSLPSLAEPGKPVWAPGFAPVSPGAFQIHRVAGDKGDGIAFTTLPTSVARDSTSLLAHVETASCSLDSTLGTSHTHPHPLHRSRSGCAGKQQQSGHVPALILLWASLLHASLVCVPP